jgi:hypothetical protein
LRNASSAALETWVGETVCAAIVVGAHDTSISAKPKRPDPEGVKTSTYECGMKTTGPSWVQFNFRYYFFALLFLDAIRLRPGKDFIPEFPFGQGIAPFLKAAFREFHDIALVHQGDAFAPVFEPLTSR